MPDTVCPYSCEEASLYSTPSIQAHENTLQGCRILGHCAELPNENRRHSKQHIGAWLPQAELTTCKHCKLSPFFFTRNSYFECPPLGDNPLDPDEWIRSNYSAQRIYSVKERAEFPSQRWVSLRIHVRHTDDAPEPFGCRG